ncbi:major capsid protein [Microvirus sp.]|nr:major capsid protein [Microvirus sp.]
MRKSKFNLSYLNSTTGNAGYLIPFLLQPTLPNDTFRFSLSSFIRAQPMVAPLMHEVKFYTQYWFVPNRIIWDDWEQFITGGGDLTAAPAFPVLKAGTKFQVGSLGDYFGFPTGVDVGGISVLPFRAYAEIWNTRYRDEDLQSEIGISYDSGEDSSTSLKLMSPNWKRDYFTTARAFTQRGAQIAVPVGAGSGTITKYGAWSFNTGTYTSKSITPNISSAVISPPDSTALLTSIEVTSGSFVYSNDNKELKFTGSLRLVYGIQVQTLDSVTVIFDMTSGNPASMPLQDSPYTDNLNQFSGFNPSVGAIGTNLTSLTISLDQSKSYSPYVSTSNTLGSISIRDLRASSALQRYAERSLEWGNRYEEFIQREFGIKPRDARIQRPEYLGGGSGTLQISEVLQTAEGQDTGVGTMRGHGLAGVYQRPIKFRAPEHGIIIGLISIRPKPVYTQGVPREFLKKSRLDFFTPELANIGMQEVLERELYFTATNGNSIFGYSDRYAEYRYNQPKVTGEFRSTLSFWNMARQFDAPPVLNASFIDMSSSQNAFSRPFSSQNTHQYLMMLRNNIKAYRPVPKRARNILK